MLLFLLPTICAVIPITAGQFYPLGVLPVPSNPFAYTIGPLLSKQPEWLADWRDAVRAIEEETCIRFTETKGGLNVEYSDTMCNHNIFIGPACATKKWSIVHEIMHVFNFLHTFQRSDRDEYVKLTPKQGNNEPVETSWIAMSFRDSINLFPYEHQSIMNYGNNAGSYDILYKDERFEYMGAQRERLTFLDSKAFNARYNCSDKCQTKLPCQNSGYVNPNDCSKCKCPDGFSGTLCSELMPSCGIIVNATQTEQTTQIVTAPRAAFSDSGKKCFHYIQAPAGKWIQWRVTNIGTRLHMNKIYIYGLDDIAQSPFLDSTGFYVEDFGTGSGTVRLNLLRVLITVDKNFRGNVSLIYKYVDSDTPVSTTTLTPKTPTTTTTTTATTRATVPSTTTRTTPTTTKVTTTKLTSRPTTSSTVTTGATTMTTKETPTKTTSVTIPTSPRKTTATATTASTTASTTPKVWNKTSTTTQLPASTTTRTTTKTTAATTTVKSTTKSTPCERKPVTYLTEWREYHCWNNGTTPPNTGFDGFVLRELLNLLGMGEAPLMIGREGPRSYGPANLTCASDERVYEYWLLLGSIHNIEALQRMIIHGEKPIERTSSGDKTFVAVAQQLPWHVLSGRHRQSVVLEWSNDFDGYQFPVNSFGNQLRKPGIEVMYDDSCR